MKSMRFPLRILLIALALLVLVPGMTVLAQEILTSAEPGYVSPEVAFADRPTDPDYIPPSLNGTDRAAPYYFIYVAGSTLRPRSSSVTWTAGGSGGCIYTNNSSEIFNIDLQIPNGATIEYLRLYYYDTAATDNRVWITSYDGQGGFTDLITIASTGATGYGTTLSPYSSVVVNNVSYSYLLNWRSMATDSTSQLCGIRVRYSLPTP